MIVPTLVRSLLLATVTTLFLSSAQADEVSDAITQATMRYVFQEAGVDDPSVAIEEVAEGHARVKVRSISGKTDPAIAFLKGSGARWKVLTLGTGFAPEDLAELGIPVSVRN